MYDRDNIIKEFRNCYGQDAEFKEGQLEAIEAVLDNKRTLVVQKTGWGKSLVYFMATKMIRQKQKKFTLIISPLLALMNNQIDSAKRLNLNVKTINSENEDLWDDILAEAKNGEVDALIISPERLANEQFKEEIGKGLASLIGLFVVDEAHCISDWGHDFRPDYRRIIDLVNLLPGNVPVLATTATANNRVVEDIKAQLGEDIIISRGPLIRESIIIDTVPLISREERMVWIHNNIDKLPGTGIVYCLTVADCILVNDWLRSRGIASAAYYADLDTEEKNRIVDAFMNNEIKVLSATTAFGMGFDKPDIGFVIHFQKPGNLVAYYQQIGRAGRQIDKAYAIMLYGSEDDEINEYFINSAFPTEKDMDEIINVVMTHPGLKKRAITGFTNMTEGRVTKCLKYLEVSKDIYIEGGGYYKTPRRWVADLEKSRAITALRYRELNTINDFTHTDRCFMEYIAEELDDETACKCGKCSNCVGSELFDNRITPEDLAVAREFMKEAWNVIKPRAQWPSREMFGITTITFPVGEGRVLSNYGDAGWGRIVAEDKYRNEYFRDELVDASAALLEDFVRDNNITCLTFIPSKRRPELVKSFASRLADKLHLHFYEGLEKAEDAVCQKELNNSYRQCENAYNSFEVVKINHGNTLLVDDMVDSRWTMAVCGYKLMSEGNGKVYPFALANSAGRGN